MKNLFTRLVFKTRAFLIPSQLHVIAWFPGFIPSQIGQKLILSQIGQKLIPSQISQKLVPSQILIPSQISQKLIPSQINQKSRKLGLTTPS